MALKIRFRQQGCKNNSRFRLVLIDSRAPRDGRYLENLGWYNPHQEKEENTFALKEDRILHWVGMGAELSEKAESLVAKGAPSVKSFLRERKEKQLAKARAVRKKAKAKK